jgi:hypothetical protein
VSRVTEILNDSRQWCGKSYPWDDEGKAWTIKSGTKDGDDWVVMVTQFIYASGVLIRYGDDLGGFNFYSDRWCYHLPSAAFAAAEAWDPETQDEPEGWHRHPQSGRRRTNGDPREEYVAP